MYRSTSHLHSRDTPGFVLFLCFENCRLFPWEPRFCFEQLRRAKMVPTSQFVKGEGFFLCDVRVEQPPVQLWIFQCKKLSAYFQKFHKIILKSICIWQNLIPFAQLCWYSKSKVLNIASFSWYKISAIINKFICCLFCLAWSGMVISFKIFGYFAADEIHLHRPN